MMKILNDPERGAEYRNRRRARWWKKYNEAKKRGVKLRAPRHIITMQNRSYKFNDNA